MNNLKRMRMAANLSQSEMAERSGIKLRTIQEYEQGKKNIDGAKLATLSALAQALDCRIRDIMENPPTNVDKIRL